MERKVGEREGGVEVVKEEGEEGGESMGGVDANMTIGGEGGG